jgi:hypothetical protein
VAVILEAVGLDDQPPVVPEEVDLVSPNPRIHLGLGKAVTTTEAEHETFELAAGEFRLAAKFR